MATTYTYQWEYANSDGSGIANIPGASGNFVTTPPDTLNESYTIDNAYVGKIVRLRVTDGTVVGYSPWSSVIAAAPSPAGAGLVYHGATVDGPTMAYYYGNTYANTIPYDSAAVTQLKWEADAGKSLSIIHFGQGSSPFWNQPFKSGLVDTCAARGAYALYDNWTMGVSLSNIIAGNYDSQLVTWFTAVKNYGKPFFLRMNHEMNGTWFTDYSGNPTNYINAWRHIHNIAEVTVGCTNISWVWCPNYVLDSGHATTMMSYYPGDAYVDWAGFDCYNQAGSSSISPGSWHDLSHYAYDAIVAATSKPIMVGEWGCNTEITSGSPSTKGAWLADALNYVIASQPNIKAMVIWNQDDPTGTTSTNRNAIETSSTAKAGYASGIADSHYLPKIVSGFATSGKVPVPS